ncbi:MAG TPA: O-antigen ligase family protein [Chitinophagaceae bacterium]|nr:O-antigen ligase family protein [Chitinophagaceae bacterium]
MTRLIKLENIIFLTLSGVFFTFIALAAYTEEYLIAFVPFVLLFLLFSWRRPEIIFFLLLVALPFSFEYNFTPDLGTDIPDEFLMILLSGLLVFQLAYQEKKYLLPIIRHPLLGVIVLSFFWLIITVIFSSYWMISLKFLVAKTWYIIPFVIGPVLFIKTSNGYRNFALFFAGSIVLASFIVLIRHSFSGFSFATINDAVHPLFRNHVNYSAMLVCCIPVLVAFFSLVSRKKLKWIVAALIVVSLIALLFSYARGAWMALVAGILAYWLIKKRLILIVYMVSVLFSIASVIWLKNNDRYLEFAHDYKTTIFHRDFGKHLVATYKLKDISTAERFYRWIAGVRMTKDSWLTGFGPATFYNNYKEYAVPAFKTWVSDNKEHSTVHNYFLLLLIEQGVAGLLLFLVLAGLMLWYCQHRYVTCNSKLDKTIYLTTGVIIAMVLTVNFLSDLIETDKVGSIFFLCAGIIISTDLNNKKLNSAPDIESIS